MPNPFAMHTSGILIILIIQIVYISIRQSTRQAHIIAGPSATAVLPLISTHGIIILLQVLIMFD